MKIHDDDFGVAGVQALGESNVQATAISNPGINDKLIRIDTSPKVPLLTFPVRPISTTSTVVTPTNVDADNDDEIGGSTGESLVTGERYLELAVINPDLTPGPTYRLPPEVLSNLTRLFRNLPDGHYAIYLVQGETQVRRLVIEVFVRDGRLIDPGDDSEGARDRPPTDDAKAAAPDNAGAIESAIESIETPPGANTSGAIERPARHLGELPADSHQVAWPATTSPAIMRHATMLASVSLALSAAGRSWRAQVDETLAKARKTSGGG